MRVFPFVDMILIGFCALSGSWPPSLWDPPRCSCGSLRVSVSHEFGRVPHVFVAPPSDSECDVMRHLFSLCSLMDLGYWIILPATQPLLTIHTFQHPINSLEIPTNDAASSTVSSPDPQCVYTPRHSKDNQPPTMFRNPHTAYLDRDCLTLTLFLNARVSKPREDAHLDRKRNK